MGLKRKRTSTLRCLWKSDAGAKKFRIRCCGAKRETFAPAFCLERLAAG